MSGFQSCKTLDVGLELRNVGEDGVFAGYGSVYDRLDDYSDTVAPGAFRETLAAHRKAGTMPAMLWQHDQRAPIGVYTAMREDDRGLQVEGRLALRTRLGAEAHELLKMGALSGLSIGFLTVTSDRHEKSGVRTLTAVDLWEVSLVTFPANDAARIASVKAATRIRTERDFEAYLWDEGGFSRSCAKAIASRGFKAGIGCRDDDLAGATDLAGSLRALARSLNPTP